MRAMQAGRLDHIACDELITRSVMASLPSGPNLWETIVLIDRTSWPEHRPWALGFVAGTVASTVWYLWESHRAVVWPGGSSLVGFTFGVSGGLLIVFECLLWWRKKVRTWRIGRTAVWMRAHIWLGMLTVPLLVYHSGLRMGGALSTAVMILFLVVIASGGLGLLLQQVLPRRMLEQVPGETIYSQIAQVSAYLRREAHSVVRAACGRDLARILVETQEDTEQDAASHMTVGAVRSVGKVQGKVLQTVVPSKPLPETAVLRELYQQRIDPYLRDGARSGSELQFPNRAASLFDDLRTKLDSSAHGVADILEDLCAQRRGLDHQLRMHFWLHSWLCIHLPLSIALVVLMFVHVWVALRYW